MVIKELIKQVKCRETKAIDSMVALCISQAERIKGLEEKVKFFGMKDGKPKAKAKRKK